MFEDDFPEDLETSLSPEDIDKLQSVDVTSHISREHLLFDTKTVLSFLFSLSKVQTAGSDIYSSSVYVSRIDDSCRYMFTFFSFGVLFQTSIASNSPSFENLSSRDVLININSLITMCNYAGSNLLLYIDETSVQAQVFGGVANLKARLNPDSAPYRIPLNDMEQLSSLDPLKLSNKALHHAVEVSSIGKKSAVTQHRMLFFNDKAAYIHTDAISAKVSGSYCDVSILSQGVTALRSFVYYSQGTVNVTQSKTNILFSSEHTCLMISKAGDSIPQTIIDLFVDNDTNNFVTVSASIFLGIVNVIHSSATPSGSLELSFYKDGIRVTTRTSDEGKPSIFNIGQVAGDRISSVIVSTSALAKSVKLFTATMHVKCWTKNDVFYIQSDPVTLAIYS